MPVPSYCADGVRYPPGLPGLTGSQECSAEGSGVEISAANRGMHALDYVARRI